MPLDGLDDGLARVFLKDMKAVKRVGFLSCVRICPALLYLGRRPFMLVL